MGVLTHSEATLRIFGDGLIPDQVSEYLGAKPSDSNTKGDEESGNVSENLAQLRNALIEGELSGRPKPLDLAAVKSAGRQQTNNPTLPKNKTPAKCLGL